MSPPLKKTTLDGLLAKAKSGDIEAENRMFQHLSKRFKLIAKRTLSDVEAEDIAQEACITVLQKYKKATSDSGLAAWATEVLRMKIGNRLQTATSHKKNKSVYENTHLSNMAITLAPDIELEIQVIDCMGKLIKSYPRYARVLNLAYQGFKVGEICEKLGISSNNYYVILTRGRKLLRGCVETGSI